MAGLRKNKIVKSHAGKGFASMDPEKRRAIAKKGGHASHKNNSSEVEASPAAATQRGFAAMDVATRKQIASKGGRTSRRNRIDWKEQAVIL